MDIYINKILYNRSLVDGPGIRTVIFLQGCDIKCSGCHNEKTWNMLDGHKISVKELFNLINDVTINKKVTISGGEPLLQLEALRELLKLFKDNNYDIALYTGHIKDELPKDLLPYLTYLKTGRFIKEKQTSVIPYVGSTNQCFERVDNIETIEK